MSRQATFVFREKKKIKRKGGHSKKASLLKIQRPTRSSIEGKADNF